MILNIVLCIWLNIKEASFSNNSPKLKYGIYMVEINCILVPASQLEVIQSLGKSLTNNF